MRYVGILFFIIFASQIQAQIPTSSPALDPDFVVLQPKETFTGYYAGQGVGALIQTVNPLRPDIHEGGVFLNNVDTLDWPGSISWDVPVGLFRQNGEFSLFNRAVYRLKGISEITPLFTKGAYSNPLLGVESGLKFLYFPDSTGAFNDTNRMRLGDVRCRGGGFGDNSRIAKIFLDTDSLDDCVIVAAPEDIDTTIISLWYAEDLVYIGDTSVNGSPIVCASDEFRIPHKINRYKSKLAVHDVDNNKVPDLLYFTDPNYFVIVFGKRDDANRWMIDTVVEVLDTSRTILRFHYFDFLHTDGIPDLIISAIDPDKKGTSIYCIDGAKTIFRNGFNFEDTKLKIPTPAKLDPKNFQGNGRGALYEWGERLFDLGDVNGSGSHSLATLCYYVPDSANLGGPAYCFIYSGGKAADEKADAMFANNATIYVYFTSMDTVRTEYGRPLNFLLGDPAFTAGNNGKLYYFEGRSDIPHKPDPRWSKVVEYKPNITTQIECLQVVSTQTLQVTIRGHVSNGRLYLLDLLGRTLLNVAVHDNAVTLSVENVKSGSYILQYTEGSRTATKKILIVNYVSGEVRRPFLPEQYYFAPYLPHAGFWIEDNYTSRIWESSNWTEAERSEFKNLKQERSSITMEEYKRQLDLIFTKGDFTAERHLPLANSVQNDW